MPKDCTERDGYEKDMCVYRLMKRMSIIKNIIVIWGCAMLWGDCYSQTVPATIQKVSVACYDITGNPTSQTIQFSVLVPSTEDSIEEKCINKFTTPTSSESLLALEVDEITNQKILARVHEILSYIGKNFWQMNNHDKDLNYDTVKFLVRRSFEIVLAHQKISDVTKEYAPDHQMIVTKFEFDANMMTVQNAEHLFSIYKAIIATAKATNFDVSHLKDISDAIRNILEGRLLQINQKAQSLQPTEREKYTAYIQQQQQRQNQVNNQMLQLLMMNHQQNMRVASEVNATMNSLNTPTPKLKTPKGYCAKHNCHYDLTQGCEFCRSPNYGGSTTPWRIRGNWDGEIK